MRIIRLDILGLNSEHAVTGEALGGNAKVRLPISKFGYSWLIKDQVGEAYKVDFVRTVIAV